MVFFHYDVITKAAPNIQPFSFLFVCPVTTTKRWEQRKGCPGNSRGELVAWCSHDKEAEGEVVPPEGVGGGGGATV